jgi:hypothetical protein
MACESPGQGRTTDEAAHVLHEVSLVQHRESGQYGTVAAIRPHRRRWPVLVQHDGERARSYAPGELWYVRMSDQMRLPCRVNE